MSSANSKQSEQYQCSYLLNKIYQAYLSEWSDQITKLDGNTSTKEDHSMIAKWIQSPFCQDLLSCKSKGNPYIESNADRILPIIKTLKDRIESIKKTRLGSITHISGPPVHKAAWANKVPTSKNFSASFWLKEGKDGMILSLNELARQTEATAAFFLERIVPGSGCRRTSYEIDTYSAWSEVSALVDSIGQVLEHIQDGSTQEEWDEYVRSHKRASD